MEINDLDNYYKGKKVIVTGHAGFKGSWLSIWLNFMGAELYGISKEVLTNPSFNHTLKSSNIFQEEFFFDLNEIEKLNNLVHKIQPEFIFHLAAQALVSVSYQEPYETIKSNVMGTASILEVVRKLNFNCSVILITSDKVYRNIEQLWGYKETDLIGGDDIYSGSKGAADIIINSYFKSFFNSKNNKVKIASARAGNVIGGGDWSKDRLVVDAIKAWIKNEKLKIRFPKATRPWQHVLEPIHGYLLLGAYLSQNSFVGESFNFGPKIDSIFEVETLIEKLSNLWFNDTKKHYNVIGSNFKESKLLALNCEKSKYLLGWEAKLNLDETLNYTVDWYKAFYKGENVYELTIKQIQNYILKRNRK